MNTLQRIITKTETVKYTSANELGYTATSKRGQLEAQKKALETTAKQLQDGIANASKYDTAVPFALKTATAVNGYESFVNQKMANNSANEYTQQARGELKQIALKHEKIVSELGYLYSEATKLQNAYVTAWQYQFISQGRPSANEHINSQQVYLNQLDSKFNQVIASINGVRANGCIGQ